MSRPRWNTVALLGLVVLLAPLAGSERAVARESKAGPSVSASQDQPAAPPASFEDWLTQLKDEARQRGFTDEVISQTLEGLQPLPRVIQSDRNQAELNPGFGRYLSTHVSNAMVTRQPTS